MKVIINQYIFEFDIGEVSQYQYHLSKYPGGPKVRKLGVMTSVKASIQKTSELDQVIAEMRHLGSTILIGNPDKLTGDLLKITTETVNDWWIDVDSESSDQTMEVEFNHKSGDCCDRYLSSKDVYAHLHNGGLL